MASGIIPNCDLELVWENPNHTSSYGAGNQVDIGSAYDYYVVVFSADVANSSHVDRLSSVTFPATFSTTGVNLSYYNGSTKLGGSRVGHYDRSTGKLSFDNGYYNGSANSAYCIPQFIYGIK